MSQHILPWGSEGKKKRKRKKTREREGFYASLYIRESFSHKLWMGWGVRWERVA